MSFTPQIPELRSVLEHVSRVHEFGVDRDIIDAVLDGIGELAAGEWAPLNRIGDQVGAAFGDGAVSMPKGFAAAYRAFVEGGWGAIGAPEDFGGQGLPFSLQCAMLEILGTANLSFALCPLLTFGAIEALTHHANEAQRRRYIPKLATGEWTGTMNLTEPQAGSDVGALRTCATPLENGLWSVKGQKIFISYGDHDLAENVIHLVLARTPYAPAGTKGISLFMVPKWLVSDDGTLGHRNGVRVVSIEHKLGLHASPTCVMAFGDEGDCVGELVGEIGGGMRAMFSMMNNARLNVGLQGVQVAEAARQRAAAFALERIQSPRSGSTTAGSVRIAEHPDGRRMLMRMKAKTEAARALVYFAARQVDLAARGDPQAASLLQLLTPLAKTLGTETGCEVASLGVQIHGGMGYVEETGAAQHFRDARILPIYEGTNGIQAADLVLRKLSLDDGRVLGFLLEKMLEDGRHPKLRQLIEQCRYCQSELLTRNVDDRLSASTPYLSMVATAVAGWLMERSALLQTDDQLAVQKQATTSFYLDQIVPEASGLIAAVQADASGLYALSAEELA